MQIPRIEGVNVRVLSERDMPVLAESFARDHAFFDDINGRFIPVEEICAAIPAGLGPDSKHLFVIERDGRVVGMLDLIEGYPEPGIMHLGFLYIVEGARGGLGRRALHGLYPWAKARGCTAMRLGVVESNLRARHLYATEGFVFETAREADPVAKRMRRSLVLRRPL